MPLQLWWLQTTLSFATLSLPALGTAALAHHTRTVWPLTGVGVVYFLLSVPVGAFTVTGSAILWLVAAGMFATRHYDRATRLVALGLAGGITLAVLTTPLYLGGLFLDPVSLRAADGGVVLLAAAGPQRPRGGSGSASSEGTPGRPARRSRRGHGRCTRGSCAPARTPSSA